MKPPRKARRKKIEVLGDFLPLIRKDMIRAAQSAGRVLMRYYSMSLNVREKKGAGLVTEADLAAEKAVMSILSRSRPDFLFLSEETNPEGQPGFSRGRWVIDPLDGTTNFVHRFPMFCVSIGAEWDGQIVAGVILAPVLKDLYVATLGGGAYLNGKRIRVSTTERLQDSLLTTGFSYRKQEWLHAEMSAFERLSMTARAIRRPGSAALDLAYTARGVFDGFWESKLSPWDVAAGGLLVREAGGQVTNFKGAPFHIEQREILATNALLHEELRGIIAPELCELSARR